MNIALIIGLWSIIVAMIGCSKEPSNSSTTLPPGGKAAAVSEGSNTWFLGATTINGTNVSGSNATIRVRTREASK